MRKHILLAVAALFGVTIAFPFLPAASAQDIASVGAAAAAALGADPGLVSRIFNALPDAVKLTMGLVSIASLICAATPTPDPASKLGKLYKVLELCALLVGRAKDGEVITVATKSAGAGPAATAALLLAAAIGLSACGTVETPRDARESLLVLEYSEKAAFDTAADLVRTGAIADGDKPALADLVKQAGDATAVAETAVTQGSTTSTAALAAAQAVLGKLIAYEEARKHGQQ